jgi:hypothetical protein
MGSVLRGSVWVVGAGAAIAAAAAVPAQAATTVGSDLSRPADSQGFCTADGPGDACTLVQLTLGTTDEAVPLDGVITRWAVRDARGTLGLRVLEGPAGQRHVVASGPPVQGTAAGVQSFPVQIPVRAGQRVGVEVSNDGALPFDYRDEQTTGERYVPPLGATPGAPEPGSAVDRTYELFYNYTVEPDADRDGLGDESQDPDHGGVGASPGPTRGTVSGPSAGRPPAPSGGSTVGGGGGCPTSGAVARGAGSVVVASGGRLIACRNGRRTPLGARAGARLFRFNAGKLALVRVRSGRSTVQGFDLDRGRSIFTSSRTANGGPASRWSVTDLVIATSGNAAWITRPAGAPGLTTVWVRHGRRVQVIDSGPLRRTLTLVGDRAINYRTTGGAIRNSGL